MQNTIESTISSVNNIQASVETSFLSSEYPTMTFMIQRHVPVPNFTNLDDEDENTQTIKLQELIKNKPSIITKKDKESTLTEETEITHNQDTKSTLTEIQDQDLQNQEQNQELVDSRIQEQILQNQNQEQDSQNQDQNQELQDSQTQEQDLQIQDQILPIKELSSNISLFSDNIDENFTHVSSNLNTIKNPDFVDEIVHEKVSDYSLTETPNNTPMLSPTDVNSCVKFNSDSCVDETNILHPVSDQINKSDSHINDLMELDDNYSINGDENNTSTGNGIFDTLMSVLQDMEEDVDNEQVDQDNSEIDENNDLSGDGDTVNKIDTQKMFFSLLGVFNDPGEESDEKSQGNDSTSDSESESDDEHISDKKVVKILLDENKEKKTSCEQLTQITPITETTQTDQKELEKHITEIPVIITEKITTNSSEVSYPEVLPISDSQDDFQTIPPLLVDSDKNQESENADEKITVSETEVTLVKEVKNKPIYRDNFEDIVNSGKQLCVHGINLQFKCASCDKTKQYKKKLVSNCPYVNDYDLDKIIYRSAKEKVTITCKKHGEFSGNHKSIEEGKVRCPKC